MTALLASVRDVGEACAAAAAGADLIDLKEPSAGALGGVAPDLVGRIVAVLRDGWPKRSISATIGDIPVTDLRAIAACVAAIGATGVDYVKVGVTPGPAGRTALVMLAGLAFPVVPVLLCDDGIDPDLVTDAVRAGFPGVMLDTARKDGRTLFDCVAPDVLPAVLRQVRAAGALTGLAGALGWADLPRILALAPDFAGFRTALCAGGRTGALDAAKVSALRTALRGGATAALEARADMGHVVSIPPPSR